eukprot:gene6928-7475_t
MPSESNFDIGANDSVRQMIQQFERKNSKPLQLGSNPNPLAVRKSSRGNRNDFQAMRMTEVKAQELTTAGPIDFSRYSVGNSSNSSSEDEGPEEVVVEVEVKKPGRKKSIRWADNLEVFQEIPVVVEHEDNYFKGNKVQFDELANLQKEPEEEKEDSPQINKSKIQKKKSFWSKLSCVSSDIIDDVMN